MSLLWLVALALIARPDLAQGQKAAGQQTVWNGVYTAAQAERGQAVYTQSCAGCHAEDLRGKGTAPSLVEEAFAFQWGDLSVADLLAKTLLMPSDKPGSLPRQSYIDVIAFMLQKNEMPAGQQELGADVNELKQTFITAKPAPAAGK